MRRRRLLERTLRAREKQRDQDRRGLDPAAMTRLAGFGAALVVFVAVYVGFHRQGDTSYGGSWGVMERLTRPLVFGSNALELIALLLVALIGWRAWRKMQGRS